MSEYLTTSVEGLITIPFNVLTAGPKNVKGTITLPNLIEGTPANAQVIVNVNLNGGSSFYTGIVGAEGFASGCYANPGDVINVVLSSSLPQDKTLNIIKTTVSFY